jgi:hypothetical protein
LGYELINEPIAPYFTNVEELNAKLEGIHKMAVAAIRQVDKKHIILLGGLNGMAILSHSKMLLTTIN